MQSAPSSSPRAIPRQAIASHPHNKHCITHPQERNVHHMYQEEGPDGYINFQCTHLGHCPTLLSGVSAVPEKQKVMIALVVTSTMSPLP